jgi:mono/diheme cytochrome c family protein
MIPSGKLIGRSWTIAALVAWSGLLAGCGAPDAQFQQNMVYLRSQEISNLGGEKLTEAQLQNVADVTTALFGTPDEPVLPQVPDADISSVIDGNLVEMAAGKVTRDELAQGRGLYRKHCVHCHGITGDGQGPTAEFLNPYPRDFRMGKYKFKSTAYGAKPRYEDLHQVVMEGISGTAMPSFKLLDSDEVEALVNYVIYLSIRGETERNLMRLATMVEGESDAEPPLLLDPQNPGEFAVEDVQTAVSSVVNRWSGVDPSQAAAPKRPWGIEDGMTEEQKQEQRELMRVARLRGRELFYGSGNCFSCHGETALGDGTIDIYDEWTAELEPKVPARLQEYLDLGALPPRYLLPRNLRQGVFRGGRRPIDIYWRIRHGIEGATMPAVPYRDPETGQGPATGLTPEDIWSIVEYVSSLQYDEFSQGFDGIAVQRDRQ